MRRRPILAYISVNIINSGKSGPNQVLDLTVAGQKAHTTIIDAAPTSQTYTMTATQDTYNLTGTHNNLIVGTFGATTGQNNEAGGTFRSGDNISGNASASNTLSLFQNTDGGITGIGNTYDVLPVGINVQNINTILINSVQSLGDSSRALDTTGIDNISGTLTNLDINSSLGPDYVLAGAKTNIAVTNYGGLPGNTTTLGGNVTVNGGNNISVKTTGVTYSSSVSVGATTAAAGNVSVTDTNQVLGSDIVTFGGAAITASGFGNIAITNAASNVTVTDHGAHAGGAGNDVTINGGTNISATVNGGAINIAGVSGTVTTNSSGSGTVGISGGTNISVIDNNNTTIAGESGTVLVYSSAGSVNVQNGTSLTINAHGAVSIGNPFGGNPTGTITVTDSGGAAVNVYGGTTDTVTADGTILVRDYTGNAVNIHGTSIGSLGAGAILDAGGGAVNVTNYGGYIDQFGGIHVSNTGIQVGVAPIVVNNGDGTQSIGNIGVESKGNVNIQDNLNGVVGRGQVLAYTNGATSVTIVGGTAAGIEDVQSVALVRTPEGQPTPGVSTLSTVSLDSIAGNETIQSDALVNLSLSNSGVYAGDAGSATVVNRNAHTLNLSLSNDVAGSSLGHAQCRQRCKQRHARHWLGYGRAHQREPERDELHHGVERNRRRHIHLRPHQRHGRLGEQQPDGQPGSVDVERDVPGLSERCLLHQRWSDQPAFLVRLQGRPISRRRQFVVERVQRRDGPGACVQQHDRAERSYVHQRFGQFGCAAWLKRKQSFFKRKRTKKPLVRCRVLRNEHATAE